MEMNTNLIEQITRKVLQQMDGKDPACVIAGVSNRHVHLCRKDINLLFGEGHELTKKKELRQPGQFACEETVTVVTEGGVIERVRVLGPERGRSQFELSASDARKLRIDPPLMKSGSDGKTPEVLLVGPAGHTTLNSGVGLSWRHVHLSPAEASALGIKDGDEACVEIPGERGILFSRVWLRVRDDMVGEFHVDLDEANACGLKNGDIVRIVL